MNFHENIIKLQLGYYISTASLNCMMDAIRSIDLDVLPDEGQSTLNEIEIAITTSQTVLDNVLSEIRELDINIDSQDEKGIEDMACKVEQMILDGLIDASIPTEKTNLVEFCTMEKVAKEAGL